MTIRGGLTAHLFAETTGTDADWVVKLIDVFPDLAPGLVQSGYQFMVSGGIFRGRYREDYANPQTYVESIMFAAEEAYKVQTHSIHHDKKNVTYIEFRIDSDR